MLLLADEGDLRDVLLAVTDLAARWGNLGIFLEVLSSHLDTILSNNPHSSSDCLKEMLKLWLKQNYNVKTSFIHTASLLSLLMYVYHSHNTISH